MDLNIITDHDWTLTKKERKELDNSITDEEREGHTIKPKNYQMPYTDLQKRELYRCRYSPMYFIENYVKIKTNVGPMIMRPYEYQRKMVRAFFEYPRVICMLPRQSGKTTTAAASLLWYSCFIPASYVLVASAKREDASDIMSRIWYSYENLPWWLKPGVAVNNTLRKELDNGTTLVTVATTANSGRGRSVSWLYIDEFAFVKPNIVADFWASIYPTISTGGRCTITSTPQTDEDKFANIWFNATPVPYSDEWKNTFAKDNEKSKPKEEVKTKFETPEAEQEYRKTYDFDGEGTGKGSDERFYRFFVDWRSVPEKIDKKGKVISYRGESYRNKVLNSGVSMHKWKVEYECQFASSSDTFINGMALARLAQTVTDPRFVDRHLVRWYEKPRPGMSYSVVLDPTGDGDDGDYAAIEVLEVGTMRQIAEWNKRDATQKEQASVLVKIIKRIHQIIGQSEGTIYYSVERNGIGIGIIRVLEHYGLDMIPGMLVDSTEQTHGKYGESLNPKMSRYRGLLTTARSKKRYAYLMKDAIERGLFKVRSKVLASQLKTFIRAGQKLSAQSGAFDDVVMATILSFQLMDEIVHWEPDLEDKLMGVIDTPDEPDYPYIPVV